MNRAQLVSFSVAWISQTATAMMIYAVPSIGPLLKISLGFTTINVGTIVGILFIGVCTTSVIFGMYGDRIGVAKVLIAAHMVQGISLLGAYYANSFDGIALAFFGVGIGYSAVTPITSKIIIDWFGDRQRGSIMGFKQTGVVAGATFAGIVFPLVGVLYGFHTSFLVGAVIVIGSATVFLVYKEPEKVMQTEKNKPSLHLLKTAFQNRLIVSVGLMGIMFAAVQAATLGYTTLFLQSTLNYTPVLAGLVLSLVSIAGIFSRPIYGAISDRFLNGERVQTLFLVALTSSLSLIAVSQLSSSAPLFLVVIAMISLGFGALGWNAVFLSYAGELSPSGSEAMGTSTAFAIAMTGQVIGAPLFGEIVDSSSSYSVGWESYSLGIFMFGLLFLMASRKWIINRPDQKKKIPNE